VTGLLSSAEVNVNNSVISNNSGFGIQNLGGTAAFRLSNSDIAFNGTAISGTTQSFNNNRIAGTHWARHQRQLAGPRIQLGCNSLARKLERYGWAIQKAGHDY
jgi:hypothetical protein